MHESETSALTTGPGTKGASQVVGISLIIPAWNEEKTITQVIREADAALAASATTYEIVVVDDGSTDHTIDLARAEAEANARIRLLQHPRHLGFGAVLRTGAQAAGGELVAITGALCPIDVGGLKLLLPFMDRHDIASSYTSGASGPAYWRVLSWGYNNVVGLLTGTRGRDVDGTVQVFHREQLLSILPESDDAFAHAELFIRAELKGLTIAEVGLPPRAGRGGQSKFSGRAFIGTLSTFARFWWSRLVFPAPGPALNPLGGWFWVGLVVLAVLAGWLLFENLSYPLLEPDEGRYAEVARKMFVTGDWVVPTLNRLPFYDKPPLFYWLVAASYWLFGITAWAARLVPTLAAFLTILVTYALGRRLVGTRAAFLASIVLALTPLFIQCGRIVILDSLLTLFVTTALFAAHEAVRGGRLRWSWWVAGALVCGLGVLTKGPVAWVLLAPPLITHVWLHRDLGRITVAHWTIFGALVLILVAPWYVAIIAREPKFAYYFFVEQHLVRFFMQEYHVEPMWFFIPVLVVGCLPWSFLILALGRFLTSRQAVVRSFRQQSMGYVVLWAGWCVLFFSASSSKLPPYVLPALPALALLAGCVLDQVMFQTSPAHLFQHAHRLVPRLASVVLVIIWLVLSIGAWRMQLLGLGGLFLHGGLAVACMAALFLWGRKLPAKSAWFVCGVVSVVLITEVTQDLVPAWSRSRSPLTRYPDIAALVGDGTTPVICYGGEWGSVPFYLGRADLIYNYSDFAPEEIQKLLSRRLRYLLIARHRSDLESFRRAMTPHMEITQVKYADEIGVALVVAATQVGSARGNRLGGEQ